MPESRTAPAPEPIRVSAVVVRDKDHRILTVRKRGTRRFMLPGGKHDPGETPIDTAIRELQEEAGITVVAADLHHLGRFEADAANEVGYRLISHVFVCERPILAGRAAAEIDQVRWLDLTQPLPADLAPLLEHVLLPLLRGQKPTATHEP